MLLHFKTFKSGNYVSSDTTAPVLTSAVGTSTGQTTATVGSTTDEANGTMYVVVTTSATQPSVAQIKAGQDHTGSSAVYSSSQSISSTGAKTFSATGLTASTTYYAHMVHTDSSANNSNRLSSSSFTTDSASGDGFPTYRSPLSSDLFLDFTSGTNGDGSQGNPWNTLTSTNNSRICSLTAGQYLWVTGNGPFPDVTQQVNAGTSTDRIVVRCHPSAPGSGFTFTGVGSRTGGPVYWDYVELALSCANGNGLVFGQSDAFAGGLSASDWRVVKCNGTKTAEPGSINAGSGIVFASAIGAVRGSILGGTYVGVGGVGNEANLWFDYAEEMEIIGVLTETSANVVYFKHANANTSISGGIIKNSIFRDSGRGLQADTNLVEYLNCAFDDCTLGIDDAGSGTTHHGNTVNHCTFLNSIISMDPHGGPQYTELNTFTNNALLGTSRYEDNPYGKFTNYDQQNTYNYTAVSGSGTNRYYRNNLTYNTPALYRATFGTQEANGVSGTITIAGGSTPGATPANWAMTAGVGINAASDGTNCGVDASKLLTAL